MMSSALSDRSIDLAECSEGLPPSVLADVPAGIGVTSLAGSLLFANDAFRRLFEFDADAAQNSGDIRLLTRGALNEEFLLSVAREGGQQQRRVCFDAERGHRQLLCTAKRIMHGAFPIYLTVVVQDMTDVTAGHRKQLRTLTELLDAQGLMRSCSWMMTINEAPGCSDHPMLWAPRSDILFGPRPPPPTFRDFVQRISSEHREELVAAVSSAIETRGEYCVDYELSASDGSVRRIRSSGRYLEDADTARRRLIGAEIDITNQHTESDRSSLAGTLLEHMEMPVMLMDRRCRYQYFNPTYAAMIKNANGTVPQVGEPVLHSVIDPERRRLLADVLARVMQGEPRVFESEFLDERGEVSKWIDFHFKPIEDASGAMVLGCDVSPLKRANLRHQYLNAELRLRMERRAAKIDAANRDLSNRVAQACDTLRSELQTLRASLDAGSQTQPVAALASMEACLEGLSRLASVGVRTPERRSVDMNRLVREARRDLALLLEGRAIEFDIDRLPNVTADPVLLRQVLHSLLSNAVAATRGCQTARIRIWATEEQGATVWSVADNGIGFDMQDADVMFSAFARRGAKPRGVGLSVAWRAIQQLNGRLWCESSPGQGATFHFILGHQDPAT